ncbi:hypothetical protein DJ533_00425 (plasmid) [Acinetobacter defluvii]|uniref:Uncharacterized protein n=1 Tax=Acinetobacter defluvii TaxID=1871111 RepID=A0A2S2F898_9GAMM|nr:hypothetical protein [Acinetobacter defluvii]AWL27183.1 hypothetical protein DJ533_00425 [Acinetobacter defluvii]
MKKEIKTNDIVCITQQWRPHNKGIYVVENITGNTVQVSIYDPTLSKDTRVMMGFCVGLNDIRHAYPLEIQEKQRIDDLIEHLGIKKSCEMLSGYIEATVDLEELEKQRLEWEAKQNRMKFIREYGLSPSVQIIGDPI